MLKKSCTASAPASPTSKAAPAAAPPRSRAPPTRLPSKPPLPGFFASSPSEINLKVGLGYAIKSIAVSKC